MKNWEIIYKIILFKWIIHFNGSIHNTTTRIRTSEKFDRWIHVEVNDTYWGQNLKLPLSFTYGNANKVYSHYFRSLSTNMTFIFEKFF